MGNRDGWLPAMIEALSICLGENQKYDFQINSSDSGYKIETKKWKY